MSISALCFHFFFNDTATTEIYTLSLHDALPICLRRRAQALARGDGRLPRPRHHQRLPAVAQPGAVDRAGQGHPARDRKSTRLNSSHANISYAVFCLKKKKKHETAGSLVSTASSL